MTLHFLRDGLKAANRNRQRLAVVAALTLFAALACTPLKAGVPSDELRKTVTSKKQALVDIYDFAEVLNAADREALAARCKTLRAKTGAGFVVVILKSLEGGEINDFTNKLFKQWGIGQKGKDNGLMLLVSMKEHKARLEVGYGLEPIIPDALAGRILDELLFPSFKQQRYADGLKGAVNRAAELVEKGEPAPPEARRKGGPPLPLIQQVLITLFLSLFVVIGSFLLGAGIGARVGPMCFFGLLFGGIPYGMGYAMAAPLAPIIDTPVAILFIVLGLWSGRKNPGSFRTSGKTGGSGAGSGPWMSSWDWGSSSGGSSGSSWSGGGFSSDSGSFGGGSSGGGGASGSW